MLESLDDGIKIIAESQLSMGKDVQVLKEDVGEIKDRLGRVESDVEVLKDDVGEIKDRLGRVEDNVVEIKHKLSEKVDLADFQKLEKRLMRLEKVVLTKAR